MKKESLDTIFYKYSILTLLMLISAINYNLFINPCRIVAGGTNGISIITEQVFKFDPSIVILVLSLAILIITIVLNEREMFKSALYASLIYPLFVSITKIASQTIVIDYSNLLVITLFAGIISGIISGIICKFEMSQGGIVLISQIISKKFKLSVSTINFIINLSIVITGGFIFGISTIMYAIIFLYVNKIVMNRIIVGVSQKKMFYIITTEENGVTDYIVNKLKSSYTLFNAKGGFEYKKKSVIMTIISNSDYFRLKEGIHEIDKKAFFIITDSYQVLGGK